jgi:hypothetical protein
LEGDAGAAADVGTLLTKKQYLSARLDHRFFFFGSGFFAGFPPPIWNTSTASEAAAPAAGVAVGSGGGAS